MICRTWSLHSTSRLQSCYILHANGAARVSFLDRPCAMRYERCLAIKEAGALARLALGCSVCWRHRRIDFDAVGVVPRRFSYDHIRSTDMTSRTAFHFRAFLISSFHFLLSAGFGAILVFLAVTDVLANPAEGAAPLWLTICFWTLKILNPPMTSFFGLSDGSQMMHLPALFLAGAWSLLVGYIVSLIWHRVERAKYDHKPLPV
jgi:hypothetical protein